MLMRVADELRLGAVYPELAGIRVLVSGLTQRAGVDIARVFAEHHARLILRIAENSDELDALVAILSESATELAVFSDDVATGADAAVDFAKHDAQRTFGGLEVAINVIEIDSGELSLAGASGEVEDLVSAKLLAATLAGRVIANRMRLTHTQGLVLTVVLAAKPETASQAAVLAVVRATLAAITRGEAETWADQAIRFNAVAPIETTGTGGFVLAGEADVAALALYLASRKGRGLSGHVFDATGVSQRR
ncbi:MAG: SDR family oxidoreductase [Hyphomicrobiaceae bacterium]|nr:SDR family oxidoreductase [Hyphomicrobiaceae bacterium]